MTSKILFVFLLIVAGCVEDRRGSTDLYRCTFERMSGTYTATARELNRLGTMITVHSGTRTFMFRRSNVSVCEKDATEST